MTVTLPIHTLPAPEPLTTDPVTALLEALDHLAGFNRSVYASKAELRLTAYHDALCSLAGTYGDNGPTVYGRAARRLPTGTLLEEATPEEGWRYTLAFHGLARDRLTRGPTALDLDTWLEMADEAVNAYQMPQAA